MGLSDWARVSGDISEQLRREDRQTCLPDRNLGIPHLPTLTLFWELTPGLFIGIEDHNFPSQKPHSTVSEWVGEWVSGWVDVSTCAAAIQPLPIFIFSHFAYFSHHVCSYATPPWIPSLPLPVFWKPQSSEMARGSRLCLKVRMFTLAILSSNDCWRCVWGHWDEKGIGVTLLIFPTQTKLPGMKHLPLQLAACFLWAFLQV